MSAPGTEANFKRDLVALIPYLRAFARSLERNVAAAEDLAQDAMLKAWTARDSFTPGTNMKAWCFMILRNQFYSNKRRSWRSTALDPEVAEQALVAADNPTDALAVADVRRALYDLPDTQREALILIGAGEMSYEEAAEICGVAVGTIKSRVSRARTALKDILEAEPSAGRRRAAPAGQALEDIMKDVARLAGRSRPAA